jgi:NADH-quinone oxidoreductase subunit M
MFVAIMYLGVAFFNEFGYWSFQYNDFTKITTLSYTEQVWLFLAFIVAVSIKIPLFPLHTWIMDTYKNAPTGAVFLLSSIMAKLGIYAIVRFLIPIFPDVYVGVSQYFVALGLFGMVYFGIAALMQQNIKRMFAYASASHLNLIAAGIFSLNEYGINGALYLMIAHAISTGGLFLLVGVINYEMKSEKKDKNNPNKIITKFKNIDDLGGIAKSAPIFTFIFAIMLFANIGLPGTNGFVSELLIIFGIYKFNYIFGFITATSLILGASYMLWMFQRAILQDDKKQQNKMRDLNTMEIMSFVPFVILIFLLGIVPDIFINKFEPTVLHFIYDILKIGVAL